VADRSIFTDEEWTAITEAPLLITVTMVAAGDHGPISMIKESAASAHAITDPGDRGAASGLVAQIVHEAQTKQARHDVEHRKGASIDELVAGGLADLQPAATALAKLPDDEAHQIGAWFVDIARSIAAASKGVKSTEQETIEKVAALFGVDAGA
jgi:hypothetical protein